MTNWMSKLTKEFGQVASDMPSPADEVISLQSPSFNWAVGNGGIVEGKAVLLYGPESSGKSLLAQLTLIEIQKKHPDCVVAWFDAEYSFNKDWFKRLGGDLSRLVVYQTNDPKKIFDFCWGELYELLQDGMPLKGVCIDSVKAILYPGDMKEDSTKVTMGGSGAKYLGSALKRLLPVIREFGVTTCLVQQVYEELDPMKALRNPYKLPDGRALKHFADYMMEVTKVENKKSILTEGKNIMGTDAQIGHKVRVKAKKNRTGAPARVAEFNLYYNSGIGDTADELFDLAVSLGVIFHPPSPTTGKPSNMLWQFGDMDPVKGQDNMREAVRNDFMLYTHLIEACGKVADDTIENRTNDLTTVDVEFE